MAKEKEQQLKGRPLVARRIKAASLKCGGVKRLSAEVDSPVIQPQAVEQGEGLWPAPDAVVTLTLWPKCALKEHGTWYVPERRIFHPTYLHNLCR